MPFTRAWSPIFAGALLFIAITGSRAQSPAPGTAGVPGRFYVGVDDTARLFHNGKEIHFGKIGTSETGDVLLFPGDRLVIQVWNQVGPRGLKLLFVSKDRSKAVNFKAGAYRYWRDPDKHDFTEREFADLKEGPKVHAHRSGETFVFKNSAEWVWGEKKGGTSYLAVLVTKAMFERFNP